MQKNPLQEKVALVTGSARRIGAEIARTLHQAGMNLLLHFNASEEAALALCEELNQDRPRSAVALRADFQEIESEQALIERGLKIWKRLDVLVNNASRFYRTPMGEVTEYAWDDLMNSNLKVPFFLSQAAASHLAAQGGCIINITDARERPLSEYAVYSISKHALGMLTKVLAKELGPSVRVNAVAPGAILWPEGENTLSEEVKEQIIEKTALKRHGRPEDVANAVLFLVRDAAFLTGEIIKVDGGRMLFS